ncbi:MAG: helix-turn-helix transcriptional regulator, partial [Thermoanaerobaculales bacterium]
MQRRIDPEFVIGCIYEAVSDPDLWNNALDAARRMFEVDAMLLVYGNLSAGDFRILGATGFDSHALSAYAGRHLNSDELVRESMNGPAGIIVSSGRSFRGKRFFRTSVYRRLMQPSDLSYIAGAAALNTTEVHASLWMARADSSPDFSVHDMHAFANLLPHVTRAMTVYHRVRQAEFQAEMAVGAFDRVAVGVVLLDVRGAPVMVNREAERIAAMKDGFVLQGEGLVADRISETNKLRDLIRRVGSSGSESEPAGAGAVRLARPSGLPDFHVIVLPLPKRCQPIAGSGAAAVLFVTDPVKSQSPVDYFFGDLYDLTDAEVRLVTQLLEGGGLTAAAEKLGLSRNTVHSQLASVFQKTGTSSQSELLTLLLTSVAPVEAPDETSGFH